MLYIFGGLSTIRGAYWATTGSVAEHDSSMYSALSTIAPLYFWGGVLLVAGLLIAAAGYLVPKRRRKSTFFYVLMVGGFFASVVYFATAVAGVSHAINWMTPAQIILLSAGHGLLAFIGGAELWKTKNM